MSIYESVALGLLLFWTASLVLTAYLLWFPRLPAR
jgi:hypothetical protein